MGQAGPVLLTFNRLCPAALESTLGHRISLFHRKIRWPTGALEMKGSTKYWVIMDFIALIIISFIATISYSKNKLNLC